MGLGILRNETIPPKNAQDIQELRIETDSVAMDRVS